MGRAERVVLIVDDSREDREAARRELRNDPDFHYRFLEAASGREGLAAFRASTADCLLLDYDLPDLDGLQFLEALAGEGGRVPVAVVMLTGRGGEGVAVEALKGGAQDYLIKGSYSPEILRKKVGEAIERVATRRELERQGAELERLYAEAREADRRKDEFLATLAHELRNPLAPILNAVYIMRLKSGDPETIGRMRDIVDQQVHHLSRLVDDLLDVSRIAQGKIQLRTRPIDLGSIVSLAVEGVRPAIEGRSLGLTLAMPSGPVRLEADPTRIEQVLANLLNNAAKFTDPGGSIVLAVERSGDEARISVKDDGIGIGPDLLPRVFDLFTQADGSLDRSQGGLGIGLALVRSLAELHGGRVEARSDGPGRGSEFVVILPTAPDEPAPALAPAAVASPDEAGSLRVLIVDDNVHAAESLAIVLRLWDHDARVAFDGPRAIELAGPFRPQAVLLDIGLPGMDGYEVARSLRAPGGPSPALLVAMTGYGRDEDVRRSKSAGFDHHLVKPIDFDVLKSLLDAIRDA